MSLSSDDGTDAPSGAESPRSEQERRLAALRQIAEQTSQTTPANPTTSANPMTSTASARPDLSRALTVDRRPPAMRRAGRKPGRMRAALLAALVTIVVVAAVAGVWLGLSRKPPRAATLNPQIINLANAHLACPFNPTWSPDGKYLAVSATIGDCSNPSTNAPVQQVIAVYDTQSGRLARQITLDTAMTSAGYGVGAASNTFTWTPDSASLVFTVNIGPFLALPPGAKHGLLLVNVSTGATRAIVATAALPPQTIETALVWDVPSGRLTHVYPSLAPSVSYQWGADGALTPSDSASAGALALWQAGTISPTSDANQLPSAPDGFFYVSTLPRWSPDGRYLVSPLTLAAHLQSGLPTGAPALTGAQCPFQLIAACAGHTAPAPDKAFSAVMSALLASGASGGQTFYSELDVAWRADGRELATILPNEGFGAQQDTAKVAIYDTRTGARVKTLVVQRTATDATATAFGQPQFAWTPTGSGLAVIDYADNTLILWRGV